MTPLGSLWLALAILALAFYLIRCARQFAQTGQSRSFLLYSLVASVGIAVSVALFVVRV